MKTLRIAVPVPLRQLFDYTHSAPSPESLTPGIRVRVPFQNRELVGMLVETPTEESLFQAKLKPIIAIIDQEPVITEDILQLCRWAADYYHFPLGEVIFHALPRLLRLGKPAHYNQESYYQLTTEGLTLDLETLSRSPRQIELLKFLKLHPEGLTAKQLRLQQFPASLLKVLLNKNYVAPYNPTQAITQNILQAAQELNSEQSFALKAIQAANQQFQVFLLNGITGSGKTEIYLQAIADILPLGQQALVLVPEIGLTPQTIQRFQARFSVPIVALHSGLSEKERLNAWLAAKNGDAKIVIGTRSAIFSPFANLGLIVIDEEHDLSFKQQEGLRYHARDLAIMRAHFKKIPIILGTATPALETLQNALRGTYQHLHLHKRAGNAVLPEFKILDIRKTPLEQGLSPSLLTTIKQHIDNGNQVMLFLNRRGFSPVLMCHSCGWLVVCKRCDARMTFHQTPSYLHCHHCDSRRAIPTCCEACREKNLTPIGLGTERLETILQKHFPLTPIARIDRDSTQRKGSIEKLLTKIQAGEYQILIGTQMLAKGHHFPNVTLVAIVDADSGFFSSDFRALERMGQLILQVSGRAGRAEKKGTVVIQTHHPDHPLLHQLIHETYHQFALSLLQERKLALLPPFQFFALFRAEAHDPNQAHDFLKEIKNLANLNSSAIQLLGPISAPMPKRAGQHRTQLLLQAKHRPTLQDFLKNLLPEIEKIRGKQKVRWSLDVDPLEMI